MPNPKKTEGRSRERDRTTTFLVAVKQRREPIRVYAVRAASPEAALNIIEGMATDTITVELAGQLTKRMARPLKLQVGEFCPV